MFSQHLPKGLTVIALIAIGLLTGCGPKPNSSGGKPSSFDNSHNSNNVACDATHPCKDGSPCENNQCKKQTTGHLGDSCLKTKECGSGKICRSNKCVEPVACAKSLDCELGEVCNASKKCELGTACSDTQKCSGPDEVCFDGNCSAAGRTCSGHEGCGATEVCDAGTCRVGKRCERTDQCVVGVEICDNKICKNILSGGGEDRCAATAKNKLTCKSGVEKCENNACVPNCPTTELCGGVCCGAGTICANNQCVVNSCNATQVACPDSTGHVNCCAAGNACLAGKCVEQGEACDNVTSFCPIISYCDTSPEAGNGHCIKYADNAKNLCLYPGSTGTFNTTVKLDWHGQVGEEPNYNQVMVIPLVGDVSGKSFKKDGIPDLVVNSFSTYNYGPETASTGVLRVFSAKSKTPGDATDINYWWDSRSITKYHTGAGYENFWTWGITTPAIGDINGDGTPNIVLEEDLSSGGTNKYRLRAVNGTDGKTIWTSPETVRHLTDNWNAIALADLDHDGIAEVLFDQWVLDGKDGHILCTMSTPGSGSTHAVTPIAADLDEKGNMEIILARDTYSYQRAPGAPTATCAPRPINPGKTPKKYNVNPAAFPWANFSAVADVFPTNPGPEIVSVYGANLYISDSNGKELMHKVLPSNQFAGPPTVADFNGDGELEIAFADRTVYTIVKPTWNAASHSGSATYLWKMTTQDQSSGITGSSVFDFDGDGKAEAVYADEIDLYVYDGAGDPLTQRTTQRVDIKKHSATAIEYPLVVDADGDGHADIIGVSNFTDPAQQGVKIYSETSNKWVPTRSVWNQHTYHYTNINDDLSIPRNEAMHWKAAWSNNFRQNVQAGNSRFAPDISVKLQDVYGETCGASADRSIKFAMMNIGNREIAAGQGTATLYVSEAGKNSYDKIYSTTNNKVLQPGESIDIQYSWTVPSKFSGKKLDFKVVVNEGDSLLECNSKNNVAEQKNVQASAANLIVPNPGKPGLSCDSSKGKMKLSFELVNSGAIKVPKGKAEAQVLIGVPGGVFQKIAEVKNSKDLSAKGGLERFTVEHVMEATNASKLLTVKIVVDPDNKLKECSESDNETIVSEDFVCYKQLLG